MPYPETNRRDFLSMIACTLLLSSNRNIKLNGFPKPKFSLGDWVCSYFKDESSEHEEDRIMSYFYRGQIIGLCYGHPEWKEEQWIYFVKVTESNDCNYERVVDFPEYELEFS